MSPPKEMTIQETVTPFKDDLAPRELAEQAVRALSEQTAESAAEKAALKAVKYSFLLIGVDIDDKNQLANFRDDLAFTHRVNRGAREIKSAAIKTCVGAVITGLIALFVLGFKDWIANFYKGL